MERRMDDVTLFYECFKIPNMTKQQQIALKEATILTDLFTPPLLALLSVVTSFEVVNISLDVLVVHI